MSDSDIRMTGFSRRTSVERVWQWIEENCQALDSESIPLVEASGRVLATDICSDVDVPGFRRAMMDGFAVQAQDISGAADTRPASLSVVAEAWPGRAAGVAAKTGQAIQVMTGAPLPAGTDVVVPVEMAERQGDLVKVTAPLPVGKHIGEVGEDIRSGEVVLRAGRRLRPQDLGVLSSIGCDRLPVIRRPVVRICMTGDELLPAGTRPSGYRVTDANSPLLRSLIQRDGGTVVFDGVTPDHPDSILEQLTMPADLILVSGGSSVGQEDYASAVLRKHGELTIHGVAMRPSSPAGVGKLRGRPVFLLPGNPVSCLCAYDFFAGRAIRRAAGRSSDWPYPRTKAVLRRNLNSKLGRLDYARVQIHGDEVEPIAISGASMLSSTTKADGFVLVPENLEGIAAGTQVEVFLYDAR